MPSSAVVQHLRGVLDGPNEKGREQAGRRDPVVRRDDGWDSAAICSRSAGRRGRSAQVDRFSASRSYQSPSGREKPPMLPHIGRLLEAACAAAAGFAHGRALAKFSDGAFRTDSASSRGETGSV